MGDDPLPSASAEGALPKCPKCEGPMEYGVVTAGGPVTWSPKGGLFPGLQAGHERITFPMFGPDQSPSWICHTCKFVLIAYGTYA